MNQTAVLSSQTFSNGRTAVSYVNSVTEIRQDRIIANVDSDLKEQIENLSDSRQSANPAYNGPEDSGAEHGIYNLSFRENRKEGSQQLSFASKLKYGKADVDIDYYNPYAGGLVGHALEVALNKVFRTKTEPDKVYKILTTQRGIQPSYTSIKK